MQFQQKKSPRTLDRGPRLHRNTLWVTLNWQIKRQPISSTKRHYLSYFENVTVFVTRNIVLMHDGYSDSVFLWSRWGCKCGILYGCRLAACWPMMVGGFPYFLFWKSLKVFMVRDFVAMWIPLSFAFCSLVKFADIPPTKRHRPNAELLSQQSWVNVLTIFQVRLYFP